MEELMADLIELEDAVTIAINGQSTLLIKLLKQEVKKFNKKYGTKLYLKVNHADGFEQRYMQATLEVKEW
jgi:C-terminal processing protease CtpA/Prc